MTRFFGIMLTFLSALGCDARAGAPTTTAPATRAASTQPDSSNTGLSNPKVLKTRATPLSTTRDGEVIENIDFDGAHVELRHNDVIVRSCRFRGAPSPFGVGDVAGCRIENCYVEWTGGNAGAGPGVSFLRCHIKNMSSGDFWRNPGNCTWEANFFEDDGPTDPAAHRDVVQWYLPGFAEARMTIRRNHFKCGGLPHNAVIFNPKQVTGLTIEDNWFEGSSYQIRTSGGVVIRGNLFERWAYNAILYQGAPPADVVLEGNQVRLSGSAQPVPFEAKHISYDK